MQSVHGLPDSQPCKQEQCSHGLGLRLKPAALGSAAYSERSVILL